jgi:C4-dicarboxylate transporter DctQ subunit
MGQGMKNLIRIVNKIEELFIGYALLGIALIATIQVFLRYTFGIAYDWVDEGARYMTILITFVGAGVCVKYGAHFSMDALVQFVPNRVKHLLKMMAHFVSAVIMGVTFYYSWVQIERLHRFEATTPSFQIPMYIPYLPIGIFTLVIALRFLIQAIKHARGLALNEPFTEGGKKH